METNLPPVPEMTSAEKPVLVPVFSAVPAPAQSRLRIFGVGHAGMQVSSLLADLASSDVSLFTVDTEAATGLAAQHLWLRGNVPAFPGPAGDPDLCRSIAEENIADLKNACAGAGVVFIVTGLGGGAGTGMAPVLARAAKAAGALVFAFVLLPLECRGSRPQRIARLGLQDMREAADGVLVISGEKAARLVDQNTSFLEIFPKTNRLLADGIRGIYRLMFHKGPMEIHLADLCSLLRERHSETSFAVADAEGPGRADAVLEKLFNHPLLESGAALNEAETVLVSLAAGPDLSVSEVNKLMSGITARCGPAQVMMGAAIEPGFGQQLEVTLLTTRAALEEAPVQPPQHPSPARNPDAVLGPQPEAGPRSSRLTPPAPAPTQERIQRLLRTSKSGGRSGAAHPRFRQGQLPLEIVSRGRFEKSEPTIHKGEDLDTPTYIRRGMALN